VGVVGHEGPGVAVGGGLHKQSVEAGGEGGAVGVVEEDGTPLDAPDEDMIDDPWYV
jgi:hypothetical protein